MRTARPCLIDRRTHPRVGKQSPPHRSGIHLSNRTNPIRQLGKIELDIMIMALTEFAELHEPFMKGRSASSTMPQKRNPISSELMLAASKAVRQHAGGMVDAMVQDFERATGPWHAEWIAIPRASYLPRVRCTRPSLRLEG